MTVAPRATRLKHIAIAGNPNCGKSTIFNALTGLRQKVGNYPGVTVEWKRGRFFGNHGEPMGLLDLPGTYSLQTRSPDEAVARDALLGRVAGLDAPDLVVCVLDAGNLERNLYLLSQIMELGLPVIAALNMVDVAEAMEIRIDVETLSRRLGVPVIPMVASKGKGLIELRQALSREPLPTPPPAPPAPPVFAGEAIALAPDLDVPAYAAVAEARLLLSLCEENLSERAGGAGLEGRVRAAQARLRDAGIDPTSAPVEARYQWIQDVCGEAVTRSGSGRLAWTDRLDLFFTHRVWGWAAFFGAMASIFFCIFFVASYPMAWIETLCAWSAEAVGGRMADGPLRSLLTDGVIAGVGGVLVFLPQILILFFFLGILEDSGYMARAAFIMDRLMSRVGLHGKSFIPLLSSFACAIPGIMAARTVENRKDRLVTILVAPLMSCSARLPVYSLMIAILLPSDQVSAWAKAGIMLCLYLFGIGVAFAMAWLFKRTLLKGETPMLLLELPPYRLPSLGGIAIRMLERGMLFVKRAGTVILALSVLLWALLSYPAPKQADATPSEAIAASYGGQLGRAIEPLIAPLGYDWKIGIGLVGSFAAREVFVGTMAIVYGIEGGDDEETAPLRDAMRAEVRADGAPVFTPLVCVGLMVFYVLAMQCVSTVALVWRETNGWVWPTFQFAYMTLLAYGGALAVYQVGRLFGFQ
jgi:ferrous iron transport protein B